MPRKKQQPNGDATTLLTNPEAKPSGKDKKNATQQRPDPAFKRIAEEAVKEAGFDTRPTELKIKQLTSPDLFLEIPLGAKTEGTPFDFFRRYSIIEFKSRNDPLNEGKLLTQIGRVSLWLGEQPKGTAKNTLNVIIMAHRPPRVMQEIEQEWGVSFRQTNQGFYELRIPPQDIVLVACDELPVVPKYAVWLLFADANSETWRKGIKMMVENNLLTFLKEAEKLYPKEYRAMSLEIEDVIANFTPAEKEEYFRELIALYAEQVNRMPADKRAKLMEQIPPEERLKGLPPEERLEGLPPEERLKGLPPEERTKGLTSEQKKRLLKELQQELGEE